jgi:hypothetical protein
VYKAMIHASRQHSSFIESRLVDPAGRRFGLVIVASASLAAFG